MARDTINITYIEQTVLDAIKYKLNWSTHFLSLPYRVVFERKTEFVDLDDDFNDIKETTLTEHTVGIVNLYGFDTIYNPDRPIELIRKVVNL